MVMKENRTEQKIKYNTGEYNTEEYNTGEQNTGEYS